MVSADLRNLAWGNIWKEPYSDIDKFTIIAEAPSTVIPRPATRRSPRIRCEQAGLVPAVLPVGPRLLLLPVRRIPVRVRRTRFRVPPAGAGPFTPADLANLPVGSDLAISPRMPYRLHSRSVLARVETPISLITL